MNQRFAAFLSIIITMLTFAASAAAQQDVDVTAELSPQVVAPGQTVNYELRVTVEGNYDINLLEHPDFGALQVLGHSAVPSFIVQNGQATRSLRVTYRLQAPEENGTYTINPPRLNVGTRTLTPTARDLRVTQNLPRLSDRPQAERRGQNAFVDITIEPERSPYVGEQIRLQYDLWVNQRQRGLQARGFADPALDGFWVEDLSDHYNARRTVQRRYAAVWEVLPLRAMAIFALRPGDTTIDAIEIPLVRRSLFGHGQEQTAHSEPLLIEVQPLPDGAPSDFDEGNVGQWQMEVEIDSPTVRVGGQLLVTARISGFGLPERLGPPSLEESEHFRLLNTEDSSQKEFSRSKVGGTRTFQFRLMPLTEGEIPVPALTFSHFDPDAQAYQSQRSPSFTVHVEPGDLPTEPEPLAPFDHANISPPPLVVELHDLHEPGALLDVASPTRSLPFWVFLLPLLGLAGLLVEPILTQRLRQYRAPARRRRRIEGAVRDIINNAGPQPDPEALLQALRLVFTEALGLTIGALTVDDLRRSFKPLGLPPELKDELIDLVDELIARRYAPSTTTKSDPRHLERTERAIADLLRWSSNSSSATSTALILFLTLGVAFAAPLNLAADEDLLTRAQQATGDEDWTQAALAWQALAESSLDPTLDYNAGTAAARAGDLGLARLHLERALAAGADTREVRDNLDRVINVTPPAFAVFPPQQMAATGLQHLAPWLVAAGLWLAFALSLFRRLFGRPRTRNAFIVPLTAALALAILSAAFWVYVDQFTRKTQIGVVLHDETPLKDAPSLHAQSHNKNSTGLPAGAVFRLRQSQDGWYLVEFPTGLVGWLPDEAVGLVHHFDS